MSEQQLQAGHWSVKFLYDIGRCPNCMRQSFLASCIGWLAVGITYGSGFVTSAGPILHCSVALALLLSGLWLLHLVVYAIRYSLRQTKLQSPSVNAGEYSPLRRSFIANFSTAFASLAIMTTLPRIKELETPKKGRGTQLAMNCYDGQCGQGTFCCQWGDSSWCCQDGTSCDSSNHACF
ncbi:MULTISPECIES: DUF3624 family protein [unclassified Mesorhizobium]|uniref:DUF3624 family protein n=1 Tax=unclassified Mesorhizobium TaxID=325217 RepID=UPI00333D57A5